MQGSGRRQWVSLSGDPQILNAGLDPPIGSDQLCAADLGARRRLGGVIGAEGNG